jgi:hypothetical protein
VIGTPESDAGRPRYLPFPKLSTNPASIKSLLPNDDDRNVLGGLAEQQGIRAAPATIMLGRADHRRATRRIMTADAMVKPAALPTASSLLAVIAAQGLCLEPESPRLGGTKRQAETGRNHEDDAFLCDYGGRDSDPR